MNPKHAPALATVPPPPPPVIKSIKQEEQMNLYHALKKVNQKF
jgi:hypothetical protein